MKTIILKTLTRPLLSAALIAASTGFCAHAAVVTSIKPLGFIAAAIAEGVTPVEVILPDGASEHDYALRPSDLRRIKNADLLVWVGPQMEAFLPKASELLAADRNLVLQNLPSVSTLLVTGDDDDDHDNTHENYQDVKHAADNPAVHGEMSEKQMNASSISSHAKYNMHLWMSPVIAKLAAQAIHDRLSQLLPGKKELLDKNLVSFDRHLAESDAQITEQLATVKNKGFFVFHDAYTYFEQHYGLHALGHFTVNPELQPGAKKLDQIKSQLIANKAVCVFAEPQFRPTVIQTVASGTNVHIGTLDPLGMNIAVSKDSYATFLKQLATQYSDCLKK